MLNNVFEIISVTVSIIAFLFGAFTLLKKDTHLYFKLNVCAVGCYALEEVWVLVNTFFGENGNMISIRLIALFGCLCFFYSASARCLDEIVDTDKKANKTARLAGIIMPVVLLGIYADFAVLSESVTTFIKVLIFIAMLPAIISSYFNLKHLMMKKSTSKYLAAAKPVCVVTLVFFIIMFTYMVPQVTRSGLIKLEILDAVSACIFALIIILCVRGAKKWKTL